MHCDSGAFPANGVRNPRFRPSPYGVGPHFPGHLLGKLPHRRNKGCKSNFVVEADAVFIIGPHFAVGNSDMSRMGGVALESLSGLEGGIQHQIGVGRGQAIGVDFDLDQPRDLTGQTFQPGLDARFDLNFFRVGQLVLELPENDVFDHDKKSSCRFSSL